MGRYKNQPFLSANSATTRAHQSRQKRVSARAMIAGPGAHRQLAGGRSATRAAAVIFGARNYSREHSNTMGKHELPFVISYLTALTGLFWLARMVGAHVHLVHTA